MFSINCHLEIRYQAILRFQKISITNHMPKTYLPSFIISKIILFKLILLRVLSIYFKWVFSSFKIKI